MCGSNLKTFIPFGRLPSHFYDFFPQSDLMSNCQASLCVFCPFLFGKQQGEDGRDKVSNENHVSDLTKSEDVLLGSRVNFLKKSETKEMKSLTQAPLPYTKSMASKVGPA